MGLNKNSGILDYFSVLVIGNNPDDEILKYDIMDDVSKPYIIYSYSDVNKIRKDRIKFYEEFKKNTNDQKIINGINEQLDNLNSMSDSEYYTSLGELYSYDSDKNIISTENQMGKWITCDKGGRIFSNYLKNFNDNGVVSVQKKDIDWKLTHMKSDRVNLYNRTWDLCVNKTPPENEKDKVILHNMRNYSSYFSNFKDKQQYVEMNCSFWTYAVIYKGFWIDMENRNEMDWIIDFYNEYIKPLPDDTLLTIYECTK